MKPDAPDELDNFAAGLFAAAREERPATPLLERVLRASSEANTGEPDPARQPARRPGHLRNVPLEKRRPSLGWLSLAAALPVAAAIAMMLRAPENELNISREDRRPAPHSPVVPTPTAPRSEAVPPDLPEPTPAAPEATVVDPSAVAGALPRARSAPQVEPEREAPVAGVTPIPLSGELELLKQAREALRQGNSEHALSLLDRYDAQRGTTLLAEATLLRIETLSALGRTEAVRELARRFVRENPDSPLVDRARRFTGESTEPR
jgi:hypothetical protein